MSAGYSIGDLVREAQTRWLKPAEVLYILQNCENEQLTHEPPQKPASGSLFLFNKRVLRFFRKDGHSWRRKKDGKTVGEAHERLKVGNVEALNCYYAHGEHNPNFQRRSYWMLDTAYDHIVLVHYRDVSMGNRIPGSVLTTSTGSSPTTSQTADSYTNQFLWSDASITEFPEPHDSVLTPSSVEVFSDVVINGNESRHLDETERMEKNGTSPNLDVSLALKKLEEQLSLDDDNLKEIYFENENSNGSSCLVHEQDSNSSAGGQGDNQGPHRSQQQLEDEFSVRSSEALTWNDMLSFSTSSSGVMPHEKYGYISFGNGMVMPQEPEDLKFPAYSPVVNAYEIDQDYYSTLFDQGQIGMPHESDPSLTIVAEQMFTIREISPDWGYAAEATKVVIVGTFQCNPSNSTWACMFGDIEVPVVIVQEGVIRCEAPPHLPGKVTLFLTSGNRESCSEVREFEYLVKPSGCMHNDPPEKVDSKSSDELLLLVRFVQMLLSEPGTQNAQSDVSESDLLGRSKAGENSWGQVIEALLVGTSTSSNTTDWLLQELLKDKLRQWLSSRSQYENALSGCSLSKREQGIIHMVSGLGFDWALTPILSSGVSINYRDINGWTALHWAARFGREKMVAELLACGASAGAVTDPSAQDPVGETPAAIAGTYGHKGLAGYLSEVELTSHLSSLTLEESHLNSVTVEAERARDILSNSSLFMNEDQLSLKDTLAAVRNATQAAARIQSAFRAHSFRRRQQKEAAAYAGGDDYGILSSEIEGLSAASKFAFRGVHDHTAALSIQKKYRGWKSRKEFLAIRQKVVKIQAHVRGYQVRKKYKVICWAVGVLDKVVLRWRRKGVGLRRFHQEQEVLDESEDEEDVMKVFRKEKVDVAINEAVARVLSMVDSREARQQYSRMLERYRQAKAEHGSSESETASTSRGRVGIMESDDLQSDDLQQFFTQDKF